MSAEAEPSVEAQGMKVLDRMMIKQAPIDEAEDRPKNEQLAVMVA
jgi:hypothetical protein